jgi:23S rRNA pseudouridine1911/1915/1917 synthase
MVVLEKSARKYNGNPSRGSPEAPVETALDLCVSEELAGLRLDQALARLLPQYSRSRLQDWVRQAQVTVNGAPAQPKDKVWSGDRLVVQTEPVLDPLAGAPQPIALSIVYEDAQIVVIDKPAGLVVHPGSGNPHGTLLNALLHHAPALAGLPRAGIVHRLDKDTSGLLVVGKTLEAQTSLVRQLQARTVSRVYVAFVVGVADRAAKVEAAIGRHPVARTRMAVIARGKAAVTHYRLLRAGQGWSQVECRLETGRTHQIRVHMQSIGHPLIGDPVYGSPRLARTLPPLARDFPRQALHAIHLELQHPHSGEAISFSAPLPADLQALQAELEQHAAAG